MKKLFISILCLMCVSVFAQKWTNPMTLEGEWSSYGIGDPYILKYKGVYYLYCSTKDRNTGVKCFSSKDLVNWSEAVMCSEDPVTRTAYAPEVVYWNGTFYMYTSPGGNGHYVLSSTSPTGPFTSVTGNWGRSIDGSVFIDDNGKWYFYHAGTGYDGIKGLEMDNPTSVVGTGNNLASMANDWTEGPTVIKRNGVYYLIYTGNHVISKGYRVDYAKNTSGPINPYTPQSRQNPILLNTEGTHVGLGHGSAFIGPDLDSYYYTYHNLVSGQGPQRKFNYDRIAWNGDKMVILGSTNWEQQAPEMADFTDFFERAEIGEDWTLSGGNWGITDNDFLFQDVLNEQETTGFKALSNTDTGDKYTAEFTIREVQRGDDNAKLGAVFGYSDESNYGTALFLSNTNKFEVRFQVNGTWSNAIQVSLPANYDYTVWHTIRIERGNGRYKFFVDGMLKATLASDLEGGKIGYITSQSHGNFGYIAFSNKVNGTGIFDIYKPVPGTIEAVHYNSGGEGVGYHDLTPENSGGKYIREDGVDIRDSGEGGHTITDIQAGEWYKYNINAISASTYSAGIRYASTANASLRIWTDDEDLTGVVTLPATGSINTWRTFTIRELNLKKGYQTLKVEAVSGEFDLYSIQINEADNTIVTKGDTFDDQTFSSEWNYSDGTWRLESGQANINGYGKRTMGDTGWSNYTVQTDVTYTNRINGGLILRVKNPALGESGNSASAGTNFIQGYYVTLYANSVVLGKQNYNWRQLASAQGEYVIDRKYTLKAIVFGDNIKVFVDDMDSPLIDYTDPEPFINGKVGIRVQNANVYFDNFMVSTHEISTSDIKNAAFVEDEVEIYPNPVSNQLYISNISKFTELTVFSIDGRQVYKSKLNGENSRVLNVGKYENGIYLLRLTGRNKTVEVKKFIKN